VEAFLASSQARVTGSALVHLAFGRVEIEGVDSPFSMMACSEVRYGERPAQGASPAGAQWLARTLAEPARLSRRAGEIARAHSGLQEQEEDALVASFVHGAPRPLPKSQHREKP
jgi:hypothetical protein